MERLTLSLTVAETELLTQTELSTLTNVFTVH